MKSKVKANVAIVHVLLGIIVFSNISCSEDINLPLVVTAQVTDIDASKAKCGGEVLSNGNSPILAKGVCWSEEKNPDITNKKTDEGEGAGKFTSYVTGLNTGNTYYVRAYATNKLGTSYGSQKEFKAIRHEEIPEISFNNESLFIHPTDNSIAIVWGGYGTETGAISEDDGELNTDMILDEIGRFKSTAANICEKLIAFDHDDWYLPSIEELQAMYKYKELIGGFENKSYWSSTEHNNYNAKYVSFYDGYRGNTIKDYELYLRCVRKD